MPASDVNKLNTAVAQHLELVPPFIVVAKRIVNSVTIPYGGERIVVTVKRS